MQGVRRTDTEATAGEEIPHPCAGNALALPGSASALGRGRLPDGLLRRLLRHTWSGGFRRVRFRNGGRRRDFGRGFWNDGRRRNRRLGLCDVRGWLVCWHGHGPGAGIIVPEDGVEEVVRSGEGREKGKGEGGQEDGDWAGVHGEEVVSRCPGVQETGGNAAAARERRAAAAVGNQRVLGEEGRKPWE